MDEGIIVSRFGGLTNNKNSLASGVGDAERTVGSGFADNVGESIALFTYLAEALFERYEPVGGLDLD